MTTMAASCPNIETFQMKDIEVGNLLGSGGFSSVYALRDRRSIVLAQERHQKQKQEKAAIAAIQRLSLFQSSDTVAAPEITNTSDHSSSSLSRLSIKQNNKSSSFTVSTCDSSRSPSKNDGDDSECSHHLGDSESSDHEESTEVDLAMKTLHKRTLSNEKKARRAAQDLQMEVKLLSKLPRHDNIIKLYGVSSDFYSAGETAFIVLEQLEESLDKSVLRWRKESGAYYGHNPGNVLSRIISRKRRQQVHLTIESQADRIQQVAIAVASAMKHCHKNRIVYRDLKPANIGFAKDGTPRLFDFACAKILKEPDAKLHHRCGTLRYMAPEVVRRQPYTFPVDVYSFGMVLWEVLMLEKPYADITEKAELSKVVMQAHRHPSLKQIASPFMQYILGNCFGEKPEDRPSFDLLQTWLSSEVGRSLESSTSSETSTE